MRMLFDTTEEIVVSVARTIARMKVERATVVDNTAKYYDKFTSYDNFVRYRAQSILTGVIHQPYLPSLDEARDIIAWASREPVL